MAAVSNFKCGSFITISLSKSLRNGPIDNPTNRRPISVMTAETALVNAADFYKMLDDAVQFLSRCCEIVTDPVSVCWVPVRGLGTVVVCLCFRLDQYRTLVFRFFSSLVLFVTLFYYKRHHHYSHYSRKGLE